VNTDTWYRPWRSCSGSWQNGRLITMLVAGAALLQCEGRNTRESDQIMDASSLPSTESFNRTLRPCLNRSKPE
jgi:hypothetical protein